MILLHQIGSRLNSNFNTLEEILALPRDTPISFDGIYSSVLDHVEHLVGFTDVTLFFMGKYLGGDNGFDRGQPLSRYCTWSEVLLIRHKLNAKLGYHTWSHRDLTALSDEEVLSEIKLPFGYSGVDYFAYPSGKVDARVAKLVQDMGYREAWSVFEGDGSQFQRHRKYLNW